MASQQNTFSACAKVKKYDERNYIDMVVDRTGVRPHYIYPDLNELFETLDAMAWHQDEPFGSTSIFAQWHVFKLAAGTRVKVLLDGQGADELLAGYHGFFASHFAGLFVARRWKVLLREMHAAERLHGLGFAGASKYIANAVLPELLRQPLRRVLGKSSSAPSWLNRYRLAIDDRDPLLRMGSRQHQSISWRIRF
jgi:asparagine synthase (glutamine-hydrolysing)